MLQRFLNADDAYRNKRLKMIPQLVEGPLAVRLMAPPRKEITVSCDILPLIWRTYEASVDPSGRKLHPALEVELDCVSSRAIRGMASILKRNLSSICIDIACVISPPDGEEADEPQACLGLFRFNHIDVNLCPQFPDRYEFEEVIATAGARAAKSKIVGFDPDVSRTSAILKIDPEELHRLADEDKEFS